MNTRRIVVYSHRRKDQQIYLRVNGAGYVEYASASGFHWAVDKQFDEVQAWLREHRIAWHSYGWKDRRDEKP